MITLVSILFIGNVFFSIQEPSDKTNNEPVYFVLASWSFPDEYGQGIEGFEIFENSTASWVQWNGYQTHEDLGIFEWNGSVFIKLRCWTWYNSTLTGAENNPDGQNTQQHNVIVTNQAGSTIFSQQNFTYYYRDAGIDPPLWFYGYEVVLNFLPLYGEYYTVTVLYEIFW